MPNVFVRLIGGLGNQLFQYATARSLAERHQVGVKLDISGFGSGNLRKFELGSYPIKATIATTKETAAFGATRLLSPKLFSHPMMTIKQMLETKRDRWYREPHFHFDPMLALQEPPILLEGYWQSERYFAEIWDLLRIELTPTNGLEPENAVLAEQIRDCAAVSLHVRRGDYVSDPTTNAYHGVCSLTYYQSAINYVAERIENAHLFVFSDDAAWTRENLKTSVPATFVEANPPDRGFRDMQLMTCCRHNIIANSSFSWWGAWLNASSDKIIVAPQKWFAVNEKNTDDLIPDSWIRL